MTPIDFPQSNVYFGPPPDMEESQVSVIHAYSGRVSTGSCDGSPMVVTAWQPSAEELKQLNAGAPVFLTFLGGLPPHVVTTSFDEAISLA